MSWEGNTNTSPLQRHLYNGKELDTDFGLNVYFYGYRLHDPALGRFTTIDPIADNFPFVFVYNYVENRVPNGIDLHGLQFISAAQAKINISTGGISLKVENLSNPTQAQIVLAKPVTRINESGPFITTTFPTVIGEKNFKSNQVKRSRATQNNATISSNIIVDRPSGSSRDRRKKRRELQRQGIEPNRVIVNAPVNIPTGNGAGGRGLGALWFITEFVNWFTNETVEGDLEAAEWQKTILANEAINIVEAAFNNESFEFPQIQGFTPAQVQSDIANYIFQGEFLNEYSAEDLKRITEVSQNLILANGIPLRTERVTTQN